MAATVIQLDALGAGFATGETRPTENQFEFQATVTGRISILMHPEIERMHGELATGTPLTGFPPDGKFPTIGRPLVSQLKSSEDSLLQFDVEAGQTYQFYAAVPGQAGLTQFDYGGNLGPYRLYLFTETSDFSATTPHVIQLDSSGFGLQMGTLETPDDKDLFAFTASVTGQAFVRVGGGAEQEFVIDVTQGQTYGVLVSGDGPYVISIHAFADDFPDAAVATIALDAAGAGSLAGRINGGRVNSLDDIDVFRFTAPKTGIMTVTLADDWWRFTGQLSVSPVASEAVTYDFTGPQNRFTEFPRVLQFHVDEGVQYTVQVSGTASGAQPRFFAGNPPDAGTFEDLSANYVLSFSIVEDDFVDTLGQGHAINFDEVILQGVAGSQQGSIETPNDRDRFSFTAPDDGYVIVALNAALGTEMQGRLTSATPLADIILAGLASNRTVIEANGKGVFTKVGNAALSRDHYVVIQVEKDQTYEFVVSADLETIGDYTVTLALYNAPVSQANYSYSSSADDGLSFEIPAPNLSSPQIKLRIIIGEPAKPELALSSSGSTNTRLVVFPLTSTNPGTTTTTVTVPTGQATGTNPLIASLLIVAARDNNVRSSDPAVVAALGAPEVSATLLASLLISTIGPANGGDDMAPLIGGTVFDDANGNGRQDAEEAGAAGEVVVLEALKGGQYVVVGTALTDAKGTYTFSEVPAGDYRVRRIAQAGSGPNLTTPVSYPIKITGDSKPRKFHFGKGNGRAKTLLPRAPRVYLVEELPPTPEGAAQTLGRVFQDGDDGTSRRHEDLDDAPAEWWLGLLPLVPAAVLNVANRRRARSAVQR